MSFSLKDLLAFDHIVIQTHDNPDADAIASGFALYNYFKKNKKTVELIYGGRFQIQKSNLSLMVESLQIPIAHVTSIEKPQLLVTVDCQYGEKNVQKFEAENIAVIDHHQICGTLPKLSDVRSNYGACATLVWELLRAEEIDCNENEAVSTALYYGLMTDTGFFSEISHPSDKDLRDTAKFNNSLITLFKNSNLSLEELHIAADALNDTEFMGEHRCAVIEAAECDPNILGIISDMLLEVDTVDSCLVYSLLPFGVKISVRSCIREAQACELAEYITEGFGGGGGHLVKAGGFIKRELLEEADVTYESASVRKFLINRLKAYYISAEIISPENHEEDLSLLKAYQKKPVDVGYVEGTDLAPIGTTICIRTMEGDISVEIKEDTIINVGVIGEIYPITRKKFESSYTAENQEYHYPSGDGFRYVPSITNSMTGERIPFVEHIKSAKAKGGEIYARRINHRMKVFTAWDKEKYYLGRPGDYLAVRKDDLHDFYIIQAEIFEMTYVEKTN